MKSETAVSELLKQQGGGGVLYPTVKGEIMRISINYFLLFNIDFYKSKNNIFYNVFYNNLNLQVAVISNNNLSRQYTSFSHICLLQFLIMSNAKKAKNTFKINTTFLNEKLKRNIFSKKLRLKNVIKNYNNGYCKVFFNVNILL